MNVLRNQPKGARFASFGLGLCIFALMPTEIGYQDIASLLARQPASLSAGRSACSPPSVPSMSQPFSFGRPDRDLFAADRDLSARKPRQSGHRHHGFSDAQSDRRPAAALSCRRFPRVDRTLKGDRLVVASPESAETAIPAGSAPAIEDPSTSNASVAGAKTAAAAPLAQRAPLDPELQAALRAAASWRNSTCRCRSNPTRSTNKTLDDLKVRPAAPQAALAAVPPRDAFSFKTSSLFFGSSLGSPESMERWRPGEEPVVMMPGAVADPDLKIMASLPVDADGPVRAGEMGESIAPKGEVNSDNQRAKTPARTARPVRRQVTRQVGEVSGGSGLFRSPRRSGCAVRSRWRRWC